MPRIKYKKEKKLKKYKPPQDFDRHKNWKTDYLTHLGISKEFWTTIIRPLLLKMHNHKCQLCGQKNKLDIHHTNYNDFTIKSLMVVCKKCHNHIHLS